MFHDTMREFNKAVAPGKKRVPETFIKEPPLIHDQQYRQNTDHDQQYRQNTDHDQQYRQNTDHDQQYRQNTDHDQQY